MQFQRDGGRIKIPTNVDVIHGFLLSENYEFDNDWPGFLTRSQYVAMSASVYLTENRLISPVDYVGGKYILSNTTLRPVTTPETIEDLYALLDDRRSLYRTVNPEVFDHYSGDDKEKEIFDRFNGTSKVIFPNFANVPAYGVNNNGDIYMTTLGEALSTNTVSLLLMLRSISLNGSQAKKDMRFYYLNGSLREVKSRTTMLGIDGTLGGSVVYGGLPSNTNANGSLTKRVDEKRQDATGDTISDRVDSTNFTTLLLDKFRSRIFAARESGGRSFGPAWIKSNLILELATGDVSSLSELPPKSNLNTVKRYMGDTYDEFQMQMLKIGRDREATESHAKEHVRNFLADYREV
jgi:hypothetical protein